MRPINKDFVFLPISIGEARHLVEKTMADRHVSMGYGENKVTQLAEEIKKLLKL